jgi:hypothetical protein
MSHKPYCKVMDKIIQVKSSLDKLDNSLDENMNDASSRALLDELNPILTHVEEMVKYSKFLNT